MSKKEKQKLDENGNQVKRKRLPGWAIALIVFAVIVAIVGCTLLGVFWDIWFTEQTDSNLGQFYKPFGHSPLTIEKESDSIYMDYTDHFTQFSDEIEKAMEPDATDDEKALAAYIIYRVGCLSNATATEKAKYSIGGGDASGTLSINKDTYNVGGKMNMTSTYYTIMNSKDGQKMPTSLDRAGIDAFKANNETYVAYEEYTQIPADGIWSDDPSLVDTGNMVIRAILPFARRIIETPEGKITWSGNAQSAVITPESATGEFKGTAGEFKKQTKEEVIEESKYLRDYSDPSWFDIYGLTAPDLSLHVITPKTILGSTVEITKLDGVTVDGKSAPYYSVKFKVDTETYRFTDESPTRYAEALYRMYVPDMIFDYVDDYSYYYDKLEVEMTVFENGYVRTWSTNERWVMQGSFSVFALKLAAQIAAETFSTEAYCYEHDTIMQGFVNRWIGDHKHADAPMNELPFYNQLKDYEQQPYGTYR